MDSSDIRWNFEKFLIGVDGMPRWRYSPSVLPVNITGDIEDLLGEYGF